MAQRRTSVRAEGAVDCRLELSSYNRGGACAGTQLAHGSLMRPDTWLWFSVTAAVAGGLLVGRWISHAFDAVTLAAWLH